MNEPQLSEELEKRFDEQFAHLSVLIDQALSYTYVDSKNMGELKIKDIKHFLATALEEQRMRYIEEVEELNVQKIDTWKKGIEWNDGYESAIWDVLVLLNGKEE